VKPHVGVAISVALAGSGACLAGLVHFLRVIVLNQLPWSAEQPMRHYYREVGESYSQGFLVGFFLCFSLAVGAVGVSAWWERARNVRP